MGLSNFDESVFVVGDGYMKYARGWRILVPGVLGILWKVDDNATTEFMKLFYIGIVQEHEPPQHR